jgi:diguanylate cyclase (GGDEF)-like protein
MLLMVAVAGLEPVNATLGRTAGDALLRGVARRIGGLLGRDARRQPLVARVAGSEFAVALRAPASSAEAQLLADAIVAAVSRPFAMGDRVVALGARVGIAASEAGDDAAALLRRASTALAEAKVSDSPVWLMGPDEEDAATRRAQLAIELRAALAHDEIELLWQPQVAITDARIVGVEALARWRHPTRGELGAEILFAAAERAGQLLSLSEHVRRKAVEEIANWPPTLGDLRVAINVTAADVAQPDFAHRFLAAIDAAGVARGRITVELTESGLIADLAAAAVLLAALRVAGLRTAIDDFGTGYSSLAYLKALPLDYLKLDRRLSQDITGGPRDRVVVRGTIEMARSLGLAVIAEGIETEEQLALLAQEGCNLYQGFLCAPPLDTGALTRLVERRSANAA